MKRKLFTLLTLLLCAVGGNNLWAQTYTNEASTVTWGFTSHENLLSTNVPADAFLSTNFTAGSNLSDPTTFNTDGCKAGWAAQTLVYYKPVAIVAKNAADAAANMLEWTITPATGITFTPENVSITACTAGGTGDPQVTIYAVYSDNSQETIQERTNPRRPDKTGQGDGPSVFSKVLTSAKSGTFKVRLYFAGLTNTGKGAAVSNIVVTGKVSGTPVATTTYTITATTNNASLGGATGSAIVAENEEVTLTATPTAAGYFTKWQKDGVDFAGNTDNPLTVTATADATYTAIFEALKSVTFNVANEYKGTSGVGYSTQYASTANKWTAPQNYYYASEGKTFTAWNDGVNDYAPNTEYTLTDNLTITPIFTTNAVSLSDLTAETTITWPFATNNNAPTLSSEGNTQYYVQQATVAGQKIDVPIFVNTENNYGISNKKGKFVNSATNAQVNAGTVFKIPAVKGMLVKYMTSQTNVVNSIGFTDDTDDLGGDGSALTTPTEISADNKTISYTYTGTADYLYLVDIAGGKYPTGISVTYPVPQTKYIAPTITVGDFNFEYKGYPVTITASEGSLQVSTDGTNYETQTSPYVAYATATTTYYAKATGNDYDESDVTSQEVTNSFDNANSYVAWIYESTYTNAPNNYNIANDQLHTTLASIYNVVDIDIKDYKSAITDNQKAELNGNLMKADLVVISEAATGSSKGLIALKEIVGNVPMLSMKLFAYTYNSDSSKNRWGWGTPKNADKAVVAITPESTSYKVLEGVTFTDGAITLFDYPNDQNHIQYVDSWQTEPTDDVVLAKTGDKPAMHASTSLKYLALGISCDDFTKYNTNVVTIVKNAAAMLIAGEELNYEEVSITPAYNKTTYVTPSALDFSNVEGLKAYVATNAANGSVTLEEVGAVPAGTPLMLIGTAETEYTVPVAASASAPAENMFVAGDGTTTFDGTTYDYILYSDGLFYQIGGGTVATTKAYLHCESDPTVTAGSRALTLVFGGEATGISAVNGEGVNAKGYYNLSGQRVSQPSKGLYIVEGKKVIIK